MKKWLGVGGIFLFVFVIYWLSNPKPNHFFDYTFQIAKAFLDGQLGLTRRPPSWLNEMVPWNGKYYSVFPLGAVLSVFPLALAASFNLIQEFPGRFLASFLAGWIAIFSWKISARYPLENSVRLLLVSFLLFGTWMWMNLTFAGSWHLALGFAMVGELGALYFCLVRKNPFLCGLFFALGFGNRTEIILLTPIFVFLFMSGRAPFSVRETGKIVFWFCLCPLILGIATLVYNQLRFSSPLQFGYSLIPGVLHEPWYQHGIFSIYAIPRNAHQMLWQPWRILKTYPYLVPTGFGGSIFISSPFLFLLFRWGSRDKKIKIGSWLSIFILTGILWCHGNPGGWQFSYRYAMVLLPWMLLIFLETAPPRIRSVDLILVGISILVNAYATYLFNFTDYVQP